jgi:hypothetical protein
MGTVDVKGETMNRTWFARSRAVLLVGLFGTTTILACNGSNGVLGGPGGFGGSDIGGQGGFIIILTGGASGAGGDGGTSGTTGSTPGTCGTTTITPNRAPVDILIVLDRSDSMGYSITSDCYCQASSNPGQICVPVPANCTDRWSAVKAAVSQTVAANPSVDWGIQLFSSPTGPSCSVSFNPQVAITAGSGAQIQSLLDSTTLALYTPTAAAVNAALIYLQSVKDANSRYILLATDGEPNCSGGLNFNDDMPATSAAVASAAASGFPVYVVGIGPAPSNLDQLAKVGGTDHYYPADSAQALTTALGAITKKVSTTCEFLTPTTPPDDSKVYVYVDKTLVTQDDANGWKFGTSNSDIILTGSHCTDMLTGVTSLVEIIFGCKDYLPPGVIP